MPRRLLGSSFIARPMRIIQQRGNETRFGNKMSRETGTRRWWKRAKVAEQGKFLTYLNRAILPKLYTVDRPRNTWQVDKNSRIQVSGERRVEIRNREGRNATTFHETIFETPDKFLLRFTPFIFLFFFFSYSSRPTNYSHFNQPFSLFLLVNLSSSERLELSATFDFS